MNQPGILALAFLFIAAPAFAGGYEGMAEAERELPGAPPSFVRVTVPELTVKAPTELPAKALIFLDEGLELRDALADAGNCADAAERVDRMESRILELKTRYWALRLKGALSGASLKSDPGFTISDAKLKRRFYHRLKSWLARDSIPELTPAESRRFLGVDRQAFTLHRDCGL